MTDQRAQDLLQRALDGRATADERRELDAHAAAHPTFAAEHADLELLVQMLEEEEEQDPPADLTDHVMRRIAARTTRGEATRGRTPQTTSHDTSQHALHPTEETMTIQQSRRGIIIGGVAFAAIAIIVFAIVSPWPAEDQTAGTMGGVQKAEKYRNTQITTSDVALSNPEIQTFLQSDAFARIQRDPELQAALNSAEVKARLERAGARESAALSALYGTGAGALADALGNADLRAMLTDANLLAMLDQAEVRAALESAELRQRLAASDLKSRLKDAELEALLKSSGSALTVADLRARLESAELRAMLRSAELRSLLAHAEVRARLAQADVRAALRSADIRAMLASAELRALLAHADIRALLASADLRAMLFNAELRARLASAEIRTR